MVNICVCGFTVVSETLLGPRLSMNTSRGGCVCVWAAPHLQNILLSLFSLFRSGFQSTKLAIRRQASSYQPSNLHCVEPTLRKGGVKGMSYLKKRVESEGLSSVKRVDPLKGWIKNEKGGFEF